MTQGIEDATQVQEGPAHLLGQDVTAQIEGWKEAQRGWRRQPGLEGTPLHVHGLLTARDGASGFTVHGHPVDPATVKAAGRPATVAWDDASLAELGDLRYPWRADLRRLQSWYRSEVLGLEPGISHSPRGRRPIGSWLPEEAVSGDPSLNFLADERILRLVRQRCATRGWGGVVERRRLFHNLLSSQPLCFNLFGPLLFEPPEVLAGVLRDAYGISARRVVDVRMEWAPPRAEHPRGGPAFDCFIEYETSRTKAGRGRGFVAIETRYAEDPRDQKPSANTAFRVATEAIGSGFVAGAADRLEARPASLRLWYNLLTARSLQRRHGYNEGFVALTACAGDPLAGAAIGGLSVEMETPDAALRRASYEDVVAAAVERSPHLGGWAAHFTQRYLDLSPIARPQARRAAS